MRSDSSVALRTSIASRQVKWIGQLICAALICGFVAASLSATLPKSATADEPLHALGAYMRWFHGDFRLNAEDPPLWGYLAMLDHSRDELTVDTQSPAWQKLPEYMWNQSEFVTQTLYRTPGNDPVRFINRSRWMMALPAAALATLLAVWAWQLAGPTAAVIATALLCFDPTFIGHGTLVKDDVPLSLGLLLCAWTIWLAGRRVTVARCMLVAVALAVGFNLKFSGVLLGPIAAAMLLSRAWIAVPWAGKNFFAATRKARFATSAAIAALSAAVIFLGIWACYGFRFAPTNDPLIQLNLPMIATETKWTGLVAADPKFQPPDPRALAAAPLPTMASIVLWADHWRLLPQAYLAGFLETYSTTLFRPCYLLGEVGRTGWWYYFPLALAFKLPLATIAAIGLAAALSVFAWRQRVATRVDRWTLLCVGLPLAIYGGMAVRTHLNLGVRHVLPICPFIFLLAALGLTRLWNSTFGRSALLIMLLGLMMESAVAFPNDIAFFNAACGGSRGGFRLLGDSNLDWGQDLPLLKQWRETHPQAKLYVAYFGMADPGYYLADYSPLPGNSGSQLAARWPDQPGVLALSANVLQGTYLSPTDREHYASLLATCKPIRLLGGTIYLFEMPSGSASVPGQTLPLGER